MTKILVKNQSLSSLEKAIKSSFLGKKIAIVYDKKLEKVAHLILNQLKEKYDVSLISFLAVEKNKTLPQVQKIYNAFLKHQMDRQSGVIALGGGMIGDIVGFAAGTYLRGISWINIPSTLLGQVDSGLGGKTGVNYKEGKNLIGVFHHPSWIICDPMFLKTLSCRDWISGYAEMLKYGLIFDSKLFENLKKLTNISRLQSQNFFLVKDKFLPFISKCLEWKKKIVLEDEKEKIGKRILLNFGHTLAHALEAETDYKVFRHGEALIWGMRFALKISFLRGHLNRIHFEKSDLFLSLIPVPPIPHFISSEQVIKRMKWDKKNEKGKIKFVLLKQIGKTVIDSDISYSLLVSTLKELRS